MTTRDVGDQLNLQHNVYNASGVLVAATVVLTVTAPDGTTSTPVVSTATVGIYTASFTLSSAGAWSWVWTISGTVVDVDRGSVLAASPSPALYATLPELKAYMQITDTTDDAALMDALDSASRGITETCGRTFTMSTTATARQFQPTTHCWSLVDDFWTTTGLIVETGTDGSTWTAYTDYELDPANGMVSGEPGWPYSRINAVGWSFPCSSSRRRTLQVTAKWGWSSIPSPVKQACLMLASETSKLKGAPFGVANMDQFGPVRVRDNPMAMRRLQPYILNPVLVG